MVTTSNGNKMFNGEMTITPIGSCGVEAFTLKGVFIYSSDTKCWYHGGASYPEEICSNIKEVRCED
jgi:hypothetical protein